jgi:hypothetical protein
VLLVYRHRPQRGRASCSAAKRVNQDSGRFFVEPTGFDGASNAMRIAAG